MALMCERRLKRRTSMKTRLQMLNPDDAVRETFVSLHKPCRRVIEVLRRQRMESKHTEDNDDVLQTSRNVCLDVTGDLTALQYIDVEGDAGQRVGVQIHTGTLATTFWTCERMAGN